ncbi:unnamed protein product, partial [Toxocara canis]|uniref:Phosphatidylinositol-3-phosphatase SAC1 n=1 Tax=Toxocara canis TaxID=6265 RepID=A0A183U0U6_TOXCA
IQNGIFAHVFHQSFSFFFSANDESTAEYKKAYTKVTDGYGLIGIWHFSKDENFLLVVTGVLSVGQISNCDIYRVTAVQFVSLRAPFDTADSRVIDLQRLMSSGMFYFATGSSSDETDFLFFRNRNLHFPLERYGIDSNKWFVRMMCGSVQVRTVYVGNKTVKLAILSRLSCRRVGTRFNVRGVDDDGHVANFVETEQLLSYENCEASFIQVRGSVPLFWEQPGLNVGSHKIKLRAVEATAPAFNRFVTDAFICVFVVLVYRRTRFAVMLWEFFGEECALNWLI